MPLSATHYDADTTEPVSCGLQTLGELLSWKRSEANLFNVAAVPLAPREPPLASCPRRTLVSHDMMGGYLDDRCGFWGSSKSAACLFLFLFFSLRLLSLVNDNGDRRKLNHPK